MVLLLYTYINMIRDQVMLVTLLQFVLSTIRIKV